jgi:two-component system, cell cycle response regulator CpdR
MLLLETLMGQSRPFKSTALVVEDDPIQRDMLALLLEESDFDVIQCEDAETAMLALKRRHPVFVVTDVNLVGSMSGVELAETACRDHPGVRVVVVSGRPAPRQLPDGVVFFSKPFLPVELIREANASVPRPASMSRN